MRTSFLLTLLFVLTVFCVSAQNNVIVFAEQGELFTLFANGVKQNESPAANVHAEGLRGEGVSLRIVFADDAQQAITKNIAFLNKNTEITAKIVMTKKGYKVKYNGEAPIGTTPAPAVEAVRSTPDPIEVVEIVEAPASEETIVTTTTVEETTISTNDGSGEGESVSLKVGVDGFNMNVNVNAGVETDATVTTTTTTTTTTGSSDQSVELNDAVVIVDDPCLNNHSDVSAISSAMQAESFADDKMNVAKQALRDACINVAGIKDLSAQFDFEDDKLAFVKYCYERCVDTKNYYQLNTVFDHSSTKEELNAFLESR